jgi:hypothetical protein
MLKKLVFLILYGSALMFTCNAQTQRALIIGINHYAPPDGYSPTASAGRMIYANLEGCLNDARAMRSVLLSRFGFLSANIDTVLDLAASREHMQNAMQKLLDDSKPGDIAVIFYAGHGSQVRNSLSVKPGHLDESVVPADAWREGVPDIRDKELSKLFNQFIDKGVDLTVILDCCHSGSMSRGPHLRTSKIRYVPVSNFDVQDGSRPLTPENRPGDHFMIFAACQSDENARETFDVRFQRHGAFTFSLLKALEQQPSTSSARNIFYAARAIMKSSGETQEPVIGGSDKRQDKTLFGSAASKIETHTLVPLINPDTVNNDFIMEGGFALGLTKGTTLACEKDTSTVLVIDSVLGMDRCVAKMMRGKMTDLVPGEVFAVTNWISSQGPLLTVYIPQTHISSVASANFATIAREIWRVKKTA